jgi:hypothetical protein
MLAQHRPLGLPARGRAKCGIFALTTPSKEKRDASYRDGNARP